MRPDFTAGRQKAVKGEEIKAWLRKGKDKTRDQSRLRMKLLWSKEFNLPINDERLLSLREDELFEQLIFHSSYQYVDSEKAIAELKANERKTRVDNYGLEEGPEVETRDDKEAQQLADSIMPDLPDEWIEWEKELLDPTKDL